MYGRIYGTIYGTIYLTIHHFGRLHNSGAGADSMVAMLSFMVPCMVPYILPYMTYMTT